MTIGPTPQQRERLQTIEALRQRVQHVHGLVERFAANSREAEAHTGAIRRALGQLRLQFLGQNFPALAQACGTLELAIRRGSNPLTKIKQLREGVGSLRFQLDAEQRAIQAAARRATEKKNGE